MGNFYTNVTVLGANAEAVVATLRGLAREAYVADLGDVCVVYDRECEDQDTEILAALAEYLATKLESRTLAVLNHDDDVLWFQLYEGSDLVTEYTNRLGGPKAGARELVRQLRSDASALRVWIVLRRPYLFQVSRHDRLASLLGLPLAAVGSGYTYIARGERPEHVGPTALHHVRAGV